MRRSGRTGCSRPRSACASHGASARSSRRRSATASRATTSATPACRSISPKTMVRLVQDVVRSLAAGGFREIILVNGHYTNVIALSAAIMEIGNELPEGTIAFPFNYWDALPPDELEAYLGAEAGPAREHRRDLGRDGDRRVARRPEPGGTRVPGVPGRADAGDGLGLLLLRAAARCRGRAAPACGATRRARPRSSAAATSTRSRRRRSASSGTSRRCSRPSRSAARDGGDRRGARARRTGSRFRPSG